MVTNSTVQKESSESIKELFYKYGNLQRFSTGSFVYMKGDTPVASYLIEKGLLKVCQLTEKGQNVTFFVRKNGDAFGFAELILQRNHPCYAQCLQKCEIWVLDAEIIQKKMKEDLEINNAVLYLMTDRLLHQQSTVELLSSKSVAGRLAWFLEQISVPDENGHLFVDLMLTHEEISNIIGCSRQTVTELLGKWKAEGKILYERKKLVIRDEQFLEHM
ncbi:Crp/Fnr family transcriptional regulator [Pseudogracilibacillus auburnensis]|uniref:Crp/Fnr family transcriptional regulator n=1 Tax=Pseudogracilibacillus auburnensis TaxID=1494959 RepID=A0A2V3W384_9BACI|nr:Crp/Fnr family transcriptional regulator [Pseudogracilibacillus auburnensis]PXW87541.1 Crp/Fnr family transcriptional regulator [Pseudogracilibacillus auburnensis]